MVPRSPSVPTSQCFRLILIGALALRVVLVVMTSSLDPRIVDEQHYHAIATSLVEGRGFAFPEGPTSLRPPLYPAFVAAVWTMAGSQSLVPVRLAQVAFALGIGWMAYLLGRALYDERTGLVAAALAAFYPTLIFSNLLILTETLFALLVLVVAWLGVRLLRQPSIGLALACGAAIGIAALTRSVLWPFPLVLGALVAWWAPGGPIRRMALALAVIAGFAAVVAPWAVRNTRLQRVPVLVDTMGGMNLRMGNYEFTPHDRIWDAVSLNGHESWIEGLPHTPPGGGEWTEGQKERWARDKAIAFMREHPGLTVWRAAIKFGDFWGLDRDFIAGVEHGLYSPPVWFTIVAGGAMLVAYPLVLLLALAGIFLTPPSGGRAHLLLPILVLFVCALHVVVFGHPRYRLPVMPLLMVYAAAALVHGGVATLKQRQAWPAVVVTAAFTVLWVVQFALRDWPAVSRLLGVVT